MGLVRQCVIWWGNYKQVFGCFVSPLMMSSRVTDPARRHRNAGKDGKINGQTRIVMDCGVIYMGKLVKGYSGLPSGERKY